MSNKKIPAYLRAAAAVAALAFFAVSIPAQVPADAAARLRAIYEKGEFNARSVRAAWLEDGSGYTILEPAPGEKGHELVRYDAEGGRRTVLASAADLVPAGETGPLGIQSYMVFADGRRVLIQTSRGNGRDRAAEIWILERPAGKLRRLTAGRLGAVSPDGAGFLFTDQGNLNVFDLDGDRTTAMTTDGAPGSISNGRAVWSPDGNRVAYVQSDSSAVRLRGMLIPDDPSYPEFKEVRFARVGEIIPSLRIGVAEARGGETRWIAVPPSKEGFYLGQVSWAGNPHELLVEKFSRFRDTREFFLADVRTGAVRRIYHESGPSWVIASYRRNAGLEWIRDGRAFVVLSEKDGWRHAYVAPREGGEATLLTPGDFDIIERGRVDEAGGWFYYYASPDNATQRYLFRVRLDGKGSPERVTPADRTGTHDYRFSPDARWAIHTYSTFDTPPVTDLVRLPEHRVERVLEDNADLRARVEPLITRPAEFLQLNIGGDVNMDAWLIKPRDFDPGRKYPVFVHVYGEPHAQTVLDRWSNNNNYHRVIADLGYLVVSMDNRGTPAPKGAAWRRSVFLSLGPLSTEEQAAGVKELGRTRPYVDLSRVGVWGWSGGGSNTLNAMFRQPDVYHVGIAVAPKPQPHLYNAWFQEIYMRTREVNAEGYERSAPLHFAEGLAGDLLIIHGTGETNTHLEITEGLVDRLIELGKSFDYMTYPNRDHGIRKGKGTSLHLRMLMVRYLLEHLPPGPRPAR